MEKRKEEEKSCKERVEKNWKDRESDLRSFMESPDLETRDKMKKVCKNCKKVFCRDCEHRDLSKLDDRFTRFYQSGERVEVEWLDGFEDYTGYGARTDGKKARFYVGMSTGWVPIYLQISNRNSLGGGGILSCAVKSVRGLGIYGHK